MCRVRMKMDRHEDDHDRLKKDDDDGTWLVWNGYWARAERSTLLSPFL
jgi:hypothetical protein